MITLQITSPTVPVPEETAPPQPVALKTHEMIEETALVKKLLAEETSEAIAEETEETTELITLVTAELAAEIKLLIQLETELA